MEGRKEYVKWDRNTNERVLIADRIKTEFPDLNIQIGGQTGLDISNDDKSQILKYFSLLFLLSIFSSQFCSVPTFWTYGVFITVQGVPEIFVVSTMSFFPYSTQAFL